MISIIMNKQTNLTLRLITQKYHLQWKVTAKLGSRHLK